MKKLFVVSLLLAAAFGVAACSKKKPSTIPESPGADAKADGSSTGGSTYGGNTAPAADGDAPADPCAPTP